MTQNDLNRAVARATGETVSEIAHRGFQPLSKGTGDATAANDVCLPDELYQAQAAPHEPVAA